MCWLGSSNGGPDRRTSQPKDVTAQHAAEPGQTAPVPGQEGRLFTWRALGLTFSCLLMRLYMAASSRSKCTLLGFRRLLRLTAGRGASSPSEELSPPLRLCSTQAGMSALGWWLPNILLLHPTQGSLPPAPPLPWKMLLSCRPVLHTACAQARHIQSCTQCEQQCPCDQVLHANCVCSVLHAPPEHAVA